MRIKKLISIITLIFLSFFIFAYANNENVKTISINYRDDLTVIGDDSSDNNKYGEIILSNNGKTLEFDFTKNLPTSENVYINSVYDNSFHGMASFYYDSISIKKDGSGLSNNGKSDAIFCIPVPDESFGRITIFSNKSDKKRYLELCVIRNYWSNVYTMGRTGKYVAATKDGSAFYYNMSEHLSIIEGQTYICLAPSTSSNYEFKISKIVVELDKSDNPYWPRVEDNGTTYDYERIDCPQLDLFLQEGLTYNHQSNDYDAFRIIGRIKNVSNISNIYNISIKGYMMEHVTKSLWGWTYYENDEIFRDEEIVDDEVTSIYETISDYAPFSNKEDNTIYFVGTYFNYQWNEYKDKTLHLTYKVQFTNYETVCATIAYKITFNNAIEVE